MFQELPMNNQPYIILVQPQLAENVGMTARAMMNCGLYNLCLVSPREDHLSAKAVAAASGAEEILQNARLYKTTREAVAGLQMVYATTARPRNQIKTVHTAEHAAAEINRLIKTEKTNIGILFGPERTGLHNDDICLADAVIEIPLNPRHCSLNLSQAVLLVGYEWYKHQIEAQEVRFVTNTTVPASREMLLSFLDFLEKELAGHPGFKDEEKRPHMQINLRNIFTRNRLTEQEINTLFGIVKYLSHK